MLIQMEEQLSQSLFGASRSFDNLRSKKGSV